MDDDDKDKNVENAREDSVEVSKEIMRNQADEIHKIYAQIEAVGNFGNNKIYAQCHYWGSELRAVENAINIERNLYHFF